jgi:hypothetical protein
MTAQSNPIHVTIKCEGEFWDTTLIKATQHTQDTLGHQKHTVSAIPRKELGTVFNNLFTSYQARLSTEEVTTSTISNML